MLIMDTGAPQNDGYLADPEHNFMITSENYPILSVSNRP